MLDIRRQMPNIHPTTPGIPPGTDPLLDRFDMDREYSLRDLAAITNVSRHAIGHYVKRRVLPPTESRGPNTRYTEGHRVRLLAIARMRAQGFGLQQMAKVLAGASLDDVFRMAGYEPPTDDEEVAPAPAAAPALALPAPAPAPAAAPAPGVDPVGAYRLHSARKRRQWESIAICPGVFVVVMGDADTEARRVAREIESTYGGVK